MVRIKLRMMNWPIKCHTKLRALNNLENASSQNTKCCYLNIMKYHQPTISVRVLGCIEMSMERKPEKNDILPFDQQDFQQIDSY